MGSKERAERISEHGTNKAMKAIALFTFKKCGNCVFRLSCLVEGVLKSGGAEKPLIKIVENLSAGCIEPQHYSGHGVLAKNAAKIMSNECGNCDSIDKCIYNVFKYLNYTNQEKNEQIRQQIHKCVKCPRIDDCAQHYVEVFNLRNYSVLLTVFLKKFKKCNKDNGQKISADLGTEQNMIAPIIFRNGKI